MNGARLFPVFINGQDNAAIQKLFVNFNGRRRQQDHHRPFNPVLVRDPAGRLVSYEKFLRMSHDSRAVSRSTLSESSRRSSCNTSKAGSECHLFLIGNHSKSLLEVFLTRIRFRSLVPVDMAVFIRAIVSIFSDGKSTTPPLKYSLRQISVSIQPVCFVTAFSFCCLVEDY